ncbi:hypothetical protein ACQPW1_09825 [Nocardia sp. CA-128927]|uniref:hypothetical protein n=1 Tax=Nocardia sp. CA-128927 TaxID=3239975 RepID=UPI003D96BDF7
MASASSSNDCWFTYVWGARSAKTFNIRLTAAVPRAIRLNEAFRSHLLRDAVKDVALARVLGNGAAAGTWGAAPAGVIVILAVLLDSACVGWCRCRGDGVVNEDGGGGGGERAHTRLVDHRANPTGSTRPATGFANRLSSNEIARPR